MAYSRLRSLQLVDLSIPSIPLRSRFFPHRRHRLTKNCTRMHFLYKHLLPLYSPESNRRRRLLHPVNLREVTLIVSHNPLEYS
jgi:hypothetical protein